jgi:hypothetical protein
VFGSATDYYCSPKNFLHLVPQDNYIRRVACAEFFSKLLCIWTLIQCLHLKDITLGHLQWNSGMYLLRQAAFHVFGAVFVHVDFEPCEVEVVTSRSRHVGHIFKFPQLLFFTALEHQVHTE